MLMLTIFHIFMKKKIGFLNKLFYVIFNIVTLFSVYLYNNMCNVLCLM